MPMKRTYSMWQWAVLAGIFKRWIKDPKKGPGIIRKINLWSDSNKYPGLRYSVSSALQKDLAAVTGDKICGYCQWVVKPGEHGYCECILKARAMRDEEVVAAWKSLGRYNPMDLYDQASGATMKDWAGALGDEIFLRNLYVKTYSQPQKD